MNDATGWRERGTRRRPWYGAAFLVSLVMNVYLLLQYADLYTETQGYIYHPATDAVFAVQFGAQLDDGSKWWHLLPLVGPPRVVPVFVEFEGSLGDLEANRDLMISDFDRWSEQEMGEIDQFLESTEFSFMVWELETWGRNDVQEATLVPSAWTETLDYPDDVRVADVSLAKALFQTDTEGWPDLRTEVLRAAIVLTGSAAQVIKDRYDPRYSPARLAR